MNIGSYTHFLPPKCHGAPWGGQKHQNLIIANIKILTDRKILCIMWNILRKKFLTKKIFLTPKKMEKFSKLAIFGPF